MTKWLRDHHSAILVTIVAMQNLPFIPEWGKAALHGLELLIGVPVS